MRSCTLKSGEINLMIDRELEVLNRTIDESGEVAIELANLRDAIESFTPDEIKRTLSEMIERIDGVANVLTALSIDLAKINNRLESNHNAESSGER